MCLYLFKPAPYEVKPKNRSHNAKSRENGEMGGGEQIIFSLLLERRASLVQEMQLMTKISFRFPGPMMPAREMAAIISGKARNLSVMGMNSSSSCLLFAVSCFQVDTPGCQGFFNGLAQGPERAQRLDRILKHDLGMFYQGLMYGVPGFRE